MKVGDKLYCKRTYINDYVHIWVTKNKNYTVILDKHQALCIIDDEGDENSVMLNEYFNDHFCSEKQLRKMKLEKLSKQSLYFNTIK